MSDDSPPTKDTHTAPRDPKPSTGGTDDPIPALTDALGGLLRGMLVRSRTEVERLASDGRSRLELRQLRKDRQVMYSKLGKEVRALLEAGELDHPGLARGVQRIQGLDDRILRAERAFVDRGEAVPTETESEAG